MIFTPLQGNQCNQSTNSWRQYSTRDRVRQHACYPGYVGRKSLWPY